jgi:hypothetical protein
MLSLVMLEAKFDLIWAPEDAGPSKANNKGTIRSLYLQSGRIAILLSYAFTATNQPFFFSPSGTTF